MENKSIGVGLMGLGVISGQVARVLRDKASLLAEQIGRPLQLKKIKVLPQDLNRPLVREFNRDLFTIDDDEFFSEPGQKNIIEAIGGNPVSPESPFQENMVTSNGAIAEEAETIRTQQITSAYVTRLCWWRYSAHRPLCLI
jgi:homoserine dehydrogenase